MDASGTGEKGALRSSRLGATDASNLNSDGDVCVCVRVRVCVHARGCLSVCACDRACVMCLQYTIIIINISPRLIMIIIKHIFLYFIKIRHTDEFPSTATLNQRIIVSLFVYIKYTWYTLYITTTHMTQFLLHLPVFLHHLPRCKYGISYPSARHETELLVSYSRLLPQSSVNYSFANLHGMIYHILMTLQFRQSSLSPLLFVDCYNHTGIFSRSKIFWKRSNNISYPFFSQALPDLHWNYVWTHRLFIPFSATLLEGWDGRTVLREMWGRQERKKTGRRRQETEDGGKDYQMRRWKSCGQHLNPDIGKRGREREICCLR